MILIIDNSDSFTYNLVQRLGELDAGLDVRVYRNDQITPDEVAALRPSHIIISPGPCTPREAGVSNEVLARYAPTVPTLGVCLGHQCIGHVFGGEVVRNARVMHGKTSPIHHDARGVFAGLSNPFEATRYHSLVIKRLDRRGRDHGRPPQELAAARRAVPPRELPDRRGAEAPGELRAPRGLSPPGPRLRRSTTAG